jgi:hypothetical protein
VTIEVSIPLNGMGQMMKDECGRMNSLHATKLILPRVDYPPPNLPFMSQSRQAGLFDAHPTPECIIVEVTVVFQSR